MKNVEITVGMTLRDKVTKTRVFVQSVDGDKVELVDIDTEGVIDMETARTVTMDSQSRKCFDILDYGKQDTPVGYTVANDGVLLKDGDVATEQGQLVFKSIIARLPGELILTAATKDKKDNRLDVFSYRPAEDKFEKLISEVGEVNVTNLEDGTIALMVKTIEPRVVVDDDGDDVLDEDGKPVMAEVAEDLQLVLYDGDYLNSFQLDCELENIEVIPDDPDNSYIRATSTSVVCYDNYNNRVLKELEDVSNLVIDRAYHRIISFHTAVAADSITIDDTDSVVALAGDTFYYQNKGHNSRRVTAPCIKELAGYKYLIDTDIRNGSETYVLANKDYEVKTLFLKKTYDRGNIISVE